MGDEKGFIVGSQNNIGEDEPEASEMEVESSETEMPSLNNEIFVLNQEKGEESNGNVVFSREAPLVSIDSKNTDGGGGFCNCGVRKLKSRLAAASDFELNKNEKPGQEKKLSRQDRLELGRLFQGAVSTHDWELAENLIFLADPQTLNDALCIALDSIWFLCTQQELYGITGLIKKVIASGAYDFTRAALRTSFLASCVSACQSRTMNLADTVTVMAQR